MENQSSSKSVLSVQDWVITLFISALPIIGFIMLFVWGFGGGVNENKSNYAKAALILWAVVAGLYLLFIVVFGAAFLSSMQNA